MLLSEEKHGDKSQPIRAVSPARAGFVAPEHVFLFVFGFSLGLPLLAPVSRCAFEFIRQGRSSFEGAVPVPCTFITRQVGSLRGVAGLLLYCIFIQ